MMHLQRTTNKKRWLNFRMNLRVLYKGSKVMADA